MKMHTTVFSEYDNIPWLHMFGLSNRLAYSLTIYSLKTLGYDYVEITTSSSQSVYLSACALRI